MSKKGKTAVRIPMPGIIREAVGDPAVRGSVVTIDESFAQQILKEMPKEKPQKKPDAKRS